MDKLRATVKMSFIFLLTLPTSSTQSTTCGEICCAPTQVSIPENKAAGEPVAVIEVDADVVTALTAAGSNSAFSLTGNQLSTAQPFDYETLRRHTAVITCTKVTSGFSTDINIIVLVTNVNDHSPVFDMTINQVNVSEMTPIDTSVATIVATDEDNPAGQVYYTLTSESNYFKLKSSTNPELLVNTTLLYDKVKNVNLILRAQDTPLSSSELPSNTATATIQVTIMDADNRPPWFLPCTKHTLGDSVICQSDGYTGRVTLSEIEPGVLPLNPEPLYAIDGDSGINEDITYSFLSGNDKGLFEISERTGNISMLKAPNALEDIRLTVLATQAENRNQFATTTVTVSVQLKSLHRPQFEAPQYRGVVSAVGTMVLDKDQPLFIRALDADYAEGLNPYIAYSVNGSSDFHISNGYLFMTSPLPDSLLNLQVVATDTTNGDSATAELFVEVKAGPTTTTSLPLSTTTIMTTAIGGSTSGSTVTTGNIISTTTNAIPSTATTNVVSTTTNPSLTSGGLSSTAHPSTGAISTTIPSTATTNVIATTMSGMTASTTNPSLTSGGGPSSTAHPPTVIVTSGGYGPQDMAALGATLSVLLVISLVVIGVLIYHMKKGKADWRKIYEVNLFRSSLGQGSGGLKEGIQYTNEAFQNDEDDGSSGSGQPQSGSEIASRKAVDNYQNKTNNSLLLLPTFLPDETSQMGSEIADNEKEVKSILTRDRRMEEGYKAVWFKEDIDPNAKEEVVIIPDSREDDIEDEEEGPVKKTAEMDADDTDLDSGLGVKIDDPQENSDDDDFSSQLDYNTVTFNGLHITLNELKKQIMVQERLKATNCDLQITNAQTGEEYSSDDVHIPKHSSVIVRRTPTVGPRRISRTTSTLNCSDSAAVASSKVANSSASLTLAKLVEMANLEDADASEEDKIKTRMHQSSLQYNPKLFSKKAVGAPPTNYTCYRCLKPGHYIRQCPLLMFQDKSKESPVKTSKGIPRSFMVKVDPGTKGAMLTSSGEYMIPAIDAEAYAKGKKERPPFLPDDELSTLVEDIPEPIPNELLCPICNDLITDGVLIPCCGNSYCDECIRNALLDSEGHICFSCQQSVSPDDLVTNKFLRQAVDNFKNSTGYAKHTCRNKDLPAKEQPLLATVTVSNSANKEITVPPAQIHFSGGPAVAAPLHSSASPSASAPASTVAAAPAASTPAEAPALTLVSTLAVAPTREVSASDDTSSAAAPTPVVSPGLVPTVEPVSISTAASSSATAPASTPASDSTPGPASTSNNPPKPASKSHPAVDPARSPASTPVAPTTDLTCPTAASDEAGLATSRPAPAVGFMSSTSRGEPPLPGESDAELSLSAVSDCTSKVGSHGCPLPVIGNPTSTRSLHASGHETRLQHSVGGRGRHWKRSYRDRRWLLPTPLQTAPSTAPPLAPEYYSTSLYPPPLPQPYHPVYTAGPGLLPPAATVGYQPPQSIYAPAPPRFDPPWAVAGNHPLLAQPAHALSQPPPSEEEFYRQQHRQDRVTSKRDEFTIDYHKEILEYRMTQKKRKRSPSRSRSQSRSPLDHSRAQSKSRSRSFTSCQSCSSSSSHHQSYGCLKTSSYGYQYAVSSQTHPWFRTLSPGGQNPHFRDLTSYDIKGCSLGSQEHWERQRYRQWEREYADWYNKYYEDYENLNTSQRHRSNDIRDKKDRMSRTYSTQERRSGRKGIGVPSHHLAVSSSSETKSTTKVQKRKKLKKKKTEEKPGCSHQSLDNISLKAPSDTAVDKAPSSKSVSAPVEASTSHKANPWSERRRKERRHKVKGIEKSEVVKANREKGNAKTKKKDSTSSVTQQKTTLKNKSKSSTVRAGLLKTPPLYSQSPSAHTSPRLRHDIRGKRGGRGGIQPVTRPCYSPVESRRRMKEEEVSSPGPARKGRRTECRGGDIFSHQSLSTDRPGLENVMGHAGGETITCQMETQKPFAQRRIQINRDVGRKGSSEILTSDGTASGPEKTVSTSDSSAATSYSEENRHDSTTDGAAQKVG